MSSPVTTSAAASTAVSDLLTGPPRTFTVACTGRFAAYLVADEGLLAVVSRDAVVPPCALVLPAGAEPDVLLPAGTQVTAGGGALRWRPGTSTEHRLTVTRWWAPDTVVPRPGRPPAGPTGTSAAGMAARQARRDLRHRLDRLTAVTDPQSLRARQVAPGAARSVLAGDADTAAGLLTSVLGLGPGLTPSGDDVATGTVLALLATAGGPDGPDRDVVRRLGEVLSVAARHRTTTVSAALLGHACQGRAAAPVAEATRLLSGTGATTSRPARVLDRLLAVGHHSGADLASGVLAVTDAVDRVGARVLRAGPRPPGHPVVDHPHPADHPRPTTFRRSA